MGSINPKVEQATRDMLRQAIRGDLEDLAALIKSVGGEAYRQVLGLCLTAAAYVAVDVSSGWPTEADVREIARIIAEREKLIDLSQADVDAYLSDAVLGFRPLEEALGDAEKAATLPLLITGSMLFRFRPEGLTWWEYLDQIWNASLTAETLDLSVTPALLIRARRAKQTRTD